MIPDKIRRRKRTFGVLKRILGIKARRDGRMRGSLLMGTDIDRKILWRARMVASGQDSVAISPYDDNDAQSGVD